MKEEKFSNKIVKVGERGQIVIPKSIRKMEKIKPKDMLKVSDIGGTITIRKIERKSPEEHFFEFIENAGLTMDDWKEIENERESTR